MELMPKDEPDSPEGETLADYKSLCKQYRPVVFERCTLLDEEYGVRLDYFGNVIIDQAERDSLTGFHVDHKETWSKGGTTKQGNLWALYHFANRLKGNRSISVFIGAEGKKERHKLKVGLRKRQYIALKAYFERDKDKLGGTSALISLLSKAPPKPQKGRRGGRSSYGDFQADLQKWLGPTRELTDVLLTEYIQSVNRNGRRKSPWSEDETMYFIAAMRKHGIKQWRNILNDRDMNTWGLRYEGKTVFSGRRTSADLKDKWRGLCKVYPWLLDYNFHNNEDITDDVNSLLVGYI
jgi:hypothetical protein